MKRSKGERAARLDGAHQVAGGLCAPALQRGDPRLVRGQAEDVGGAGEQPGLAQLRRCAPRPGPRCPWCCGRRNGVAAPPSGPGRSARRCSAAPPRRAGARHGCRRRGRVRGRRRAGCRAGALVQHHGDDLRDDVAGALRCTTVSPTRMSLRAISSSLCSVACCTMTPPTLTGSSTARGVSAPVRPTWISMPQQRGGRPARPGISRRWPSAARGRRSRGGPARSSRSSL